MESRSCVGAIGANTIERFPDVVGRSVACDKFGNTFDSPDTNSYRYNARSELTNAAATVDAAYRYTYDFDDIGNRESSSERGTNYVYDANNLNQYTLVGRGLRAAPQEEFIPRYDDDGNQTLVKTATGIWQVTYNGENRPVLWTQGTNTISMSFDRMGRRVTKNAQRFVYNGYLQIANHHSSTSTSHFNYYIWDPTEPVATRPLAWKRGTSVAYYTHDGNKNVSEVIASDTDVAAHYEYAPFGALTVSCGETAATNPWRFSSEYAEDDTATVYYNYRHYEPVTGRWMSRDPIGEEGGVNLFGYCENNPILRTDATGCQWDISRTGDIMALARPTSDADTFGDLATLLHLDLSDYQKWAHTTDVDPDLCKEYQIPNLVVFQTGEIRFYPDEVPYSIFSIWKSNNAQLAAIYKSAGYLVREEDVSKTSQVVDCLGTDGLYKYYYTGHGGKDADLIVELPPWFWLESEQSVPPNRYTLYGISEMVLQACYSATFPYVNGWLMNVAKAGSFSGFDGSVNSLDVNSKNKTSSGWGWGK